MKIQRIEGQIGAMLSLRHAPESLKERLKTEFTFPNPAYESALKYSPWGDVPKNIDPDITFYREEGNRIFFPRGLMIKTLPKKFRFSFARVKWLDVRHEVPVEFPEFLMKLNTAQISMIEAFKRAIRVRRRPFGTFLFVAPTSRGKTLAQACIAAETGQRTLVLCITDLIRNAWYRDLYEGFGIPKREIGLIQQKKMFIGEHFTLASVQTLNRRKQLWKEINKNFGCVILDEAHKITAPTLYQYLMACPAKFILGGTATPDSETSPSYYITSTFGAPVKRLHTIVKDTDTSISLKEVRVVTTNFKYKMDRFNFDIHDLALSLAADEERNRTICESAYDDYMRGESVLIVVKRVPHLWMIYEMMKELGIHDANVLHGESNANKIYTEKLIQAVLNKKVRCLVATIQAIKLGGNLNPLNRLHLAWPCNKSDLEQLIGRIRRRSDGKDWTALTYYLDSKVPYLKRKFVDKAIPVFRKMRVPGFENMFAA